MDKKIALSGVLVNFVLGVSKITVGILSRSSSVLAEGVHSAMDVVSSAISYVGIMESKKPADKEHPYGHYKAEVISGFVITIILFITALWIMYEAVLAFLNPQPIIAGYIAVGVMLFSAAANAVMSHLKIKYGKKYDSISLVSDGVHSRVDVLTSVAVLAGLFVSGYFIYADSILAFLIGLYILKESFSLGKEATDALQDVSAGAETEGKIRQIVKRENIKLEDLKTQKRGPKVSANLTINLPSGLKVEQAFGTTKKLEKTLLEKIPKLEYVAVQITSHKISESYYKGSFLGKGFGWQRRGRMQGKALGPGGYCVCKKCGYKKQHKRGVPCATLKCPKCKTLLSREGTNNA